MGLEISKVFFTLMESVKIKEENTFPLVESDVSSFRVLKITSCS